MKKLFSFKNLNFKNLILHKYESNFVFSKVLKYVKMAKENIVQKDLGVIMKDKQESATHVTEGSATVHFATTKDVFYNPVQEFNRDISVAVLRLHASDLKIIKKNKLASKSGKSILKITEEDFKLVSDNHSILPLDVAGQRDELGIIVLEALAASGLRSIRYAKEVGGIRLIVANDYSRKAVECINTNVCKNDVQHIVQSSCSDGSMVMNLHSHPSQRFDVIDLDPYGSPHTFLDAALRSVSDGGLLLVTSTDMAVLCGVSPETCYAKYGSLSLKGTACHEMAVRILLQCIEANANKAGRYIVPLLSLSVDFYARVFVRVFSSPSKCKQSFSKMSFVHQCVACESHLLQPLGHVLDNGRGGFKYRLGSPAVGRKCDHCGAALRTAGPVWSKPIHDLDFAHRLRASLPLGGALGTHRRIEGVIAMITEELPNTPLYYSLDHLTSVIRMSCFRRTEFVSAMLHLGYEVSGSHMSRSAVKTNAPTEVIWRVLRARRQLPQLLHGGSDEEMKRNSSKLLQVPDEDDQVKQHETVARRLLFGEAALRQDAAGAPISFEEHPDATPASKKERLLRFQMNPCENWGPKARSTASSLAYNNVLQDKSRRRQGFRSARKRPKMMEGEEKEESQSAGEDVNSSENSQKTKNLTSKADITV